MIAAGERNPQGSTEAHCAEARLSAYKRAELPHREDMARA